MFSFFSDVGKKKKKNEWLLVDGITAAFQGKLVYANQGKPSDYQWLSQNLNLTGTIAITRYGGAGRAAKVSVRSWF